MTEEVTLTPSQQRVIDFVMNGTGHVTVSGPPGSGKTFLAKYLIDAIGDSLGVTLAAPTHQAKIVLSEMSGMEACTIHSLMKVHPETLEDIQIFDQSKIPDLSKLRWLFVDEWSMYDKKLFQIIMKSIPAFTRIIAFGDKDQIQPVSHEPGVLSPFYTDPRFTQIEMTDIMRQSLDNPIIQVATDIREGGWIHHNWNKENKTGVFKVKSISELVNSYLRVVKTPEDLINYRFLAYTNKVVDKVNGIIRKHVYKTDKPIIEGEKLVLQEPVMVEHDDGIIETIYTNGETITVKSIEVRNDTVHIDGSPDFNIECASILARSDYSGIEHKFSVFYGNEAKEEFDFRISEAAGVIKQMPRGVSQRNAWDSFWCAKKRYIDVKSLGACTIHKSQGSTVKGVWLALHDISYADDSLQQQLCYVAVTRPTQFCLYFDGSK
ncbi:DNA helicase [Aeromonas phage ZPAH1]|nr:DNA helicase [Aeromonas phage ZPAH1]